MSWTLRWREEQSCQHTSRSASQGRLGTWAVFKASIVEAAAKSCRGLPIQSTCVLWTWRRHRFCSQGVARGRRVSVLGSSKSGHCCLQMMWFLLASSERDLQHTPGRFAAKCEAVGMRVSTSKSEAMVLCRKKVDCSFWVGSELLSRAKEFKYLRVLSEGKMEREIDKIGAASAVMWALYQTVVVKKELSRKAKLSICQSICVPTLNYGHELWVVTERMRSQIKAAEMSFPCRVTGLSFRDRVRSSDIQNKIWLSAPLKLID